MKTSTYLSNYNYDFDLKPPPLPKSLSQKSSFFLFIFMRFASCKNYSLSFNTTRGLVVIVSVCIGIKIVLSQLQIIFVTS